MSDIKARALRVITQRNSCVFFGWLLLIAICTSCTINGTLQGLTGYYNKTRTEVPGIFASINDTLSPCAQPKPTKATVFVTNGIELKKCLQDESRAIIYLWQPKCVAENCKPLGFVQHKCDSAGYNLYNVAQYYDAALMELEYDLEKPIFGIDTDYYGTDFTKKYVSRFLQDAVGIKKHSGLYLLIENGKFVKSVSSVQDITG
jgi:hypothetical protein